MAERPRMLLLGVGGAGVNTVTHLCDSPLAGIELMAVDTSAQSLARFRNRSSCDGFCRLMLSAGTRGHGTGGNHAIGAAAAVAARDALSAAIDKADVVFLTAGLGGGTGGGAGPVIANQARAAGALVIGFGIMPFAFEPPSRFATAAAARERFAAACDAMVVVDNRRAAAATSGNVGLEVALRVADDIVRQAVQGVDELVGDHGYMNVDLSVVRRLLAGAGESLIALGSCASGRRSPQPATDAMRAALASPLCDMTGLRQARAVLLQATGGADLSVQDVAAAVDLLTQRLPADAEVVVGVTVRQGLRGGAHVTMLAAGAATVAVPAAGAATVSATVKATGSATRPATVKATRSATATSTRATHQTAATDQDRAASTMPAGLTATDMLAAAIGARVRQAV